MSWCQRLFWTGLKTKPWSLLIWCSRGVVFDRNKKFTCCLRLHPAHTRMQAHTPSPPSAWRTPTAARSGPWCRKPHSYVPRMLTDWFACLPGNKIDLAEKREVLRQRAEDFAEAQSMLYLETSAKESDNVEKLFLDLACELIREAKQNKLDNNDTAPMPGEGKTISYLSCCSLN